MQWDELWQARTGCEVKADEAAIWESEIAHEISNPTRQEMLAGVRLVAERKRMGKIKFRPCLDNLISALHYARKQKSARKSRLEILIKLKADIKAAMPDNVEAMDILYRCDDWELIQRAEAYARHELGFTRPDMRVMGKNGVQGQISGIIKNVKNEVKTRDRG